MRDNKKIIHIIRIIIIIIIFIMLGIFSLSYTINNNNNYKNKLIKEIKAKYSLSEEITYVNTYSDYYIFSTKDKVYVLDNQYKEVYKEDLQKLAPNNNNYDIIYRAKKLMYEKTIHNKEKITYEYYDIETYKKISDTVLEK